MIPTKPSTSTEPTTNTYTTSSSSSKEVMKQKGFFSPFTTWKRRTLNGKHDHNSNNSNKKTTSTHKPKETLLRRTTSSSNNPYNYTAYPAIAPFHRDEIVTGAELSFSSTTTTITTTNRSNNFQFYDVCGIHVHHEPSDSTEATADSSSHEQQVHPHQDGVAWHHRQYPPIPSAAADDEEARAVIQAQTSGRKRRSHNTNSSSSSSKPLHKFMIKQVHSSQHRSSSQNNKDKNQDLAILHLIHETKFWRRLSHSHCNLLTLRGMSFGGDNLFASQWDSYFLMTDRISETLAQRLDRWRKCQGTLRSSSSSSVLWWDQTKKQQQQQPSIMIANNTNKVPPAKIDTSSLEFRMKLVYAQNLASVLAFLHSKQIVVRNLHPESIGFLASDDTLQLMDLGQAVELSTTSTTMSTDHPKEIKKHTTRTTITNISSSSEAMLQQQNEHPLFLMTPGGQPYRYMAPELLTTIHPMHIAAEEASVPTYTTNVDSYSWAMICFELLTLHRPYGKMKAGQHLTRVCLPRSPNQRSSIRPHLEVYQLSPALERLLKRAWRQDPVRRCDAQEIDLRLQKLLQDQLYS